MLLFFPLCPRCLGGSNFPVFAAVHHHCQGGSTPRILAIFAPIRQQFPSFLPRKCRRSAATSPVPACQFGCNSAIFATMPTNHAEHCCYSLIPHDSSRSFTLHFELCTLYFMLYRSARRKSSQSIVAVSNFTVEASRLARNSSGVLQPTMAKISSG